MNKKALVYTNDKKQPVLTLQVRGEVEPFARIQPKSVILSGYAGSRIRGKVTIVPLDKYPFRVLETKAINGRHIRYELSAFHNSKESGYVLTVENRKKDKGRYYDHITLKTDSAIKPNIHIVVYGVIKDRSLDTTQ